MQGHLIATSRMNRGLSCKNRLVEAGRAKAFAVPSAKGVQGRLNGGRIDCGERMTGAIATVFELLAASRTARRRARNQRAGARGARPASVRHSAGHADARTGSWLRLPRPGAGAWFGAAGVLVALAGALVIAMHARMLSATAEAARLDAVAVQLGALQPLLPGASFQVPKRPGVSVESAGSGAVITLAGMHAEAPLRIDLCSQMPDPARPRLLPLRIGYRFDDVARWVVRNNGSAGQAGLRNVVLAGAPMPALEITGTASSETLRLRWDSESLQARWVGVGSAGTIVPGVRGEALLRQEGWLAWQGIGALRIVRRASTLCPQAGEMVLQLYRLGPASVPASAPAARSLVVAVPAQGVSRSVWLPPGEYHVPAAAPARLEDQALFDQLLAHGLVRLGRSGLAELAPPDLAALLAAPDSMRAAGLSGWDSVHFDDTARRLLDRLYYKADGDYVREQVRIFNIERRLLAWRLRATALPFAAQVTIGGAPAATSGAMPAAAARLFARVPQDWGPWTRVADWPSGRDDTVLTLALPHAAAGGETLQLLVAGQLKSVSGARVRGAALPACTGRACPAGDAVQQVGLEMLPGARAVTLALAPLDLAALAAPGDQQYRHLRLGAGRLSWQPLAGRQGAPRLAPPAEVVLADRLGAPLWSAGAPSGPAVAAGLAPLLGLNLDHANSIAGMLARLPSDGTPHRARLALDLALQSAATAALDCLGMRRGRFDGGACSGGTAAPEGRQAGLVVLDTETGDVLAAAGAGGGRVDPANWREVRDFDRADPARSPLRLPAFQHDGGSNRSPGSTFKVISALGLELAAQRDPQLGALLDGLPLERINRMAADKAFAFRTDAAAYPANTRLAHITNFRDQGLDRRAQDGRLGLAQALTYSLNTWFAWAGELSDRSLFGRPDGGVPDLQPLEPGALAGVRPIVEMAQRLGFEQALRLDGGLLPADYPWSAWDALQGTPAHIDPIHTRHELRQMAIGLRMQATPLQMALAAGAVGQGHTITPRLLLALDDREGQVQAGQALGVRLDRIRAGMKGVIDSGTAAGAFRGAAFDRLRAGLYGKTGTAPTGALDAAGRELATVWFTGWLEPGSLPGQAHRLAVAAFVSHSEATGGEHAAPIVAAVLRSIMRQSGEQKDKTGSPARQ
jgi:cell division protein FtsI/penicillin-binding protein 2